MLLWSKVELLNEVIETLDGKITANTAEMFGRETKYLLTKPEYILRGFISKRKHVRTYDACKIFL